jgi:DNA replication protein DnaC
MLTHPTAERLRALGLTAMAEAFVELNNTPEAADLPREDWLGLLVDREATLADAILDRILHRAHRIELKGDSLRKRRLPEIAAPA